MAHVETMVLYSTARRGRRAHSEVVMPAGVASVTGVPLHSGMPRSPCIRGAFNARGLAGCLAQILSRYNAVLFASAGCRAKCPSGRIVWPETFDGNLTRFTSISMNLIRLQGTSGYIFVATWAAPTCMAISTHTRLYAVGGGIL